MQKPDALIDEKTAVACDFYVMKGDTDNRLKALLDLFNGEIWKDDKQIFDIRARKNIITDKNNERAEINVYSFPLSPITEIQRAIDDLHPDVALTLLEGTYCAMLQNVAALHKETALASRERLYALSGKACENAIKRGML